MSALVEEPAIDSRGGFMHGALGSSSTILSRYEVGERRQVIEQRDSTPGCEDEPGARMQ